MSKKITLQEFESKCDTTFEYLYEIISNGQAYNAQSKHFLALNPDVYSEVNKITAIFTAFNFVYFE